MVNTSQINLESIVLHKVGNKIREEDLKFSKSPLKIDGPVKELLLKYFISPFKSNEYYNFYHESDINLNPVYSFISKIFDDPDELYQQSMNIARHLYEQSTHPKVKEGELYVVYLRNSILNEEHMDAIGIFKSESKETYLKVYPQGDGFAINYDDGININRLDKGCLIFNTEQEDGYMVATIDNLSRGNEAFYWKEEFLKVKPREDNFYHTQNIMTLCKNFVTERLPVEYEISKADQVDLLNKSVKFLKENDTFEMDNFTDEVIKQPELINTFKEYKNQFEAERDIQIDDSFEISESAIKKQARVFKSVIKLDKNFHIYIHGNRENIVKGYDDQRRMNYYQLFFNEES